MTTGASESPPEGALERRIYTGREHMWAVDPLTRLNDGLVALTPTFALLLGTILFNKSKTAENAYAWLNGNYTPFQINAWWTFGITSVVYWIGGLIFMAVDLLEWPRWAYNYKLQPEQKVTAQDYMRVCWIVLRNQVRVSANGKDHTLRGVTTDSSGPSVVHHHGPREPSQDYITPTWGFDHDIHVHFLSTVRRGWVLLCSSGSPWASLL